MSTGGKALVGVASGALGSGITTAMTGGKKEDILNAMITGGVTGGVTSAATIPSAPQSNSGKSASVSNSVSAKREPVGKLLSKFRKKWIPLIGMKVLTGTTDAAPILAGELSR